MHEEYVGTRGCIGYNRREARRVKYSFEERLNIGKQIYNSELTKYDASVKYNISINCARDYMRLYRDANHLPPKNMIPANRVVGKKEIKLTAKLMEEYEAMSREELLQELVRSKIDEARLKNGYAVKGVGAEKVYVRLKQKNMR